MQVIEKETRYYIQSNDDKMFYSGNGFFTYTFSLRYLWYANPTWMLDESNPDRLLDCKIVAEHYATD